MKDCDFSQCITKYFSVYLPGLRNVSHNTIYSYRDAFRLFLLYCRDVNHMDLSKLCFDNISEELIVNFLSWLEKERSSSLSSINQRLAAMRAFFRYAQCEFPQHFSLFNKILNIPFRKAPKAQIEYLSRDELTKYLSLPDQSSRSGRRDYTLLCLLYDTGARVQEIADLTVRDIRLNTPAIIRLTGKGKKTRIVPLMAETKNILENYLSENGLNCPEKLDFPLFVNKQHQKITRSGISYIVKKYADRLPTNENITPHVFRHTKAMHLLQADINIIYIRDLLGHTDVKTTEIYARADTEMKRKALERIPPVSNQSVQKSWTDDQNLIDWLNSLGKSLS